jgi:hypothetical protein
VSKPCPIGSPLAQFCAPCRPRPQLAARGGSGAAAGMPPGKSTRTRFQGWRRLLPPLACLLKAHSTDLHLIKLGETVQHASDRAITPVNTIAMRVVSAATTNGPRSFRKLSTSDSAAFCSLDLFSSLGMSEVLSGQPDAELWLIALPGPAGHCPLLPFARAAPPPRSVKKFPPPHGNQSGVGEVGQSSVSGILPDFPDARTKRDLLRRGRLSCTSSSDWGCSSRVKSM